MYGDSLILLMFSVVVCFCLLRTDSCSTHYTGALCGLGFDPATGESLFPQHDIEISFDVSIQQQDLDLVSFVRSVKAGVNQRLVLLLHSKLTV